MSKWIRLLNIFILLLIVDIAMKYYVVHHVDKMSWAYPFYPYGGIGVFKDFCKISFSINLVENTGAAWGIFSNYPKVLVIIRIFIVVGLVIYLAFFNKERKRQMPLILILSGAIGNILDFIFYGKVIDMFHFKFGNFSYPVFNFADFFITVGIIWLFIISIKEKFERKKNEN